MEIGLIFHLGLYSVYAYDDIESAKRRKIKNGSEWYFKRLLVKEGDYRPVSGWQSTQKFHLENYNSQDYFEAEREFKLDKLDLDSWMELAVSINCTYVIITAKHHENFCNNIYIPN